MRNVEISQINEFISRQVVFNRILNRYNSAVNISELSEETICGLTQFCIKCFIILWDERNNNNVNDVSKIFYDRIKPLDKETEGLIVPSRSGKNIANSLEFSNFSF